MEAALNLEDDVYFADLSKQISLLIMDDDEDSRVHCPSVNLEAFSQDINPATHPSFVNYDYHQTCKRSESKGTGVFIPRSSHSRRKNAKQARFNGNKFQRPSQDHNNSRGIIPQMAYNNNNNNISPSYEAFNHRRF